jgi:hypothetical protein
MNKIEDSNAKDIHDLILYVMWSKDKIAGGVKKEQAINALSRIIDYDLELMKSLSLKHEGNEDE